MSIQGVLPFIGARRRSDKPEVESILERFETSVSADWRERALDAVRRTCEAVPDFISDDVWKFGALESTKEDRALGMILRKAAKAGYCTKTDRVRPSQRSHGSGKPVWKSLLYRG